VRSKPLFSQVLYSFRRAKCSQHTHVHDVSESVENEEYSKHMMTKERWVSSCKAKRENNAKARYIDPNSLQERHEHTQMVGKKKRK